MKSNNLLSFEDQKKLFERYSIDTLESLDLIYDIIKEDTPLSFSIIFDKKYEENKDNYEGRNEYTYGTRIANFDISEIANSLNDLSDQELAYISTPVIKAISKINPDQQEIDLIPKLIEFEKAQQASLTNRFTPIYKGMLLKDIKNFFSKFSLSGLEYFDNILDYCNHDRINDIRRVKNEALDIKYKKYKNNVMTIPTEKNFNLTKFKSTFSSLTDREMEFLHELVENAAMYLDCIQEYSDYYKEEIEDFDLNDYPIKDMNELLDSIEKEQTIIRPLLKAPSNIEDDEEKEKTK